MHLIQVIDDNARFRFNIQAVERLFRILYSLLDFETLRSVFFCINEADIKSESVDKVWK